MFIEKVIDNVTTAEQQNINARENYYGKRYFIKLRFLFINFNKFQGIGSVMWLDLQLAILDASTNEIRHLDEMFMGKRRSIYLMGEFHAAGNEITYFKTLYFSHMLWLKYLDILKNKLTHMGNFRALYLGDPPIPQPTIGIQPNGCPHIPICALPSHGTRLPGTDPAPIIRGHRSQWSTIDNSETLAGARWTTHK